MCLVGSNGPSSNPTWLAAMGNPLKKQKPVSTFFPLQLGIYQPGQAGATLRGRPVWGSQRISSTSSLSVLPFSLAQSTPWCWSKAHGEADQKDQQMTRFQDLLGKSVELVSISIMFEVTIIYIYIFTIYIYICVCVMSLYQQKGRKYCSGATIWGMPPPDLPAASPHTTGNCLAKWHCFIKDTAKTLQVINPMERKFKKSGPQRATASTHTISRTTSWTPSWHSANLSYSMTGLRHDQRRPNGFTTLTWLCEATASRENYLQMDININLMYCLLKHSK